MDLDGPGQRQHACRVMLVGDRSGMTAMELMEDVRARLANRVQLTTDGLKAYPEAVEGVFKAGNMATACAGSYSSPKFYNNPDYLRSGGSRPNYNPSMRRLHQGLHLPVAGGQVLTHRHPHDPGPNHLLHRQPRVSAVPGRGQRACATDRPAHVRGTERASGPDQRSHPHAQNHRLRRHLQHPDLRQALPGQRPQLRPVPPGRRHRDDREHVQMRTCQPVRLHRHLRAGQKLRPARVADQPAPGRLQQRRFALSALRKVVRLHGGGAV